MSSERFLLITRAVDSKSMKFFGPFDTHDEAQRFLSSIASVRVIAAIQPLQSPEALRMATKHEALRLIAKS